MNSVVSKEVLIRYLEKNQKSKYKEDRCFGMYGDLSSSVLKAFGGSLNRLRRRRKKGQDRRTRLTMKAVQKKKYTHQSDP